MFNVGDLVQINPEQMGFLGIYKIIREIESPIAKSNDRWFHLESTEGGCGRAFGTFPLCWMKEHCTKC